MDLHLKLYSHRFFFSHDKESGYYKGVKERLDDIPLLYILHIMNLLVYLAIGKIDDILQNTKTDFKLYFTLKPLLTPMMDTHLKF